MGLEAKCSVEYSPGASPKKTPAGKNQKSAGKAHFAQKALEFRGDFRLDIPLGEIKFAEAKSGALHVKWHGGIAIFHLGEQAEKWALKIRYPKPLIDKIGIKAGMTVWVAMKPPRAGKDADCGDPDFWRDLGERAGVVERKPKSPVDAILFFAHSAADLAQVDSLRESIVPNGFIWTIYPKGQQSIRESDVMGATKKSGMVDVKICSFSERYSALKAMIPVAKRAKA